MQSLAKTFVLLAFGLVALDAATASAQVEERDHRRQPPPQPAQAPETRPETRDHRAPPSDPPRRYRRRPGPKIMLPLKVDIGLVGASGDSGFMSGVELRAGVHWASLSPVPTMWDVGLGIFGVAMIGGENATPATDDDDVLIGGAYLEVGKVLNHGRFWRTWATGRGEYFGADAFGDEGVGFGAAGRLTAELYASGVGIEPRGIFLGTYAIGVYAEVAVRAIDKDVNPLQATLGLTFRTPLVWSP